MILMKKDKSRTEDKGQEKPAEESKENEEDKPVEKSKEYRIKETEEDVALDSEKDASPDAFKEEIKQEAEKSDILMKYLAPIIVFLLVGGAVSAATWYYAKPERAQKTEEKIQTPPEVKEEPTTTPPATTTQPATPAQPEKKETTYTVKEGDSMSSIANANGMSSQELATYNGITDVNNLHIGQVLKIPAK